jgi:hypothetical protein
MLNIAKRLDERGYAMVYHDHTLGTGFVHGLVTLASVVGAKRRRRPPIVEVYLNYAERDALKDGRWLTQPINVPFNWKCRVVLIKAYGPIHAALSLMCVDARRYDTLGDNQIKKMKMSTMMEYSGEGRQTLELILRILEMHRPILTGETLP